MPVVFYYNSKGEQSAKTMPQPKRMADISAWFRQARRVLPEIPNPSDSDWRLVNEEATLKEVTFELVDTFGDKRTVLIRRDLNMVPINREMQPIPMGSAA